MKSRSKKPAPRGKSGNRETCQAAILDRGNPATQTHARQAGVAASPSSIRRKVLRKLEQIVSPQGVPGWLARPQPVFDDQPPARLLQTDPGRVLRHLKMIDAGDDSDSLPPASEEMKRTARRG